MIHTGSYLGVLTEHYDVMITDPPYSSRCHDGQSTRRGEIEYQCWSLDQYTELCYWAHHHVSGWWVIITDHVSWHEVDIRARAHGRYCFAPVPIVTPGLTVRLAGDGPASWAVYAHVSRPTAKDWAAWRSLPGAYLCPRHMETIKGAKSLDLMLSIVRDYSSPGHTVVDPCAGTGTTLRAARILCRGWAGAEIDPERADLARARVAEGYTETLI